jgi:hypothetical protein
LVPSVVSVLPRGLPPQANKSASPECYCEPRNVKVKDRSTQVESLTSESFQRKGVPLSEEETALRGMTYNQFCAVVLLANQAGFSWWLGTSAPIGKD